MIIVFFILQIAIPGFTELLIFNPSAPNAWMFLTSIFLHSGFVHLFYNSYALILFGLHLESRIGAKDFLLMFILAGIAGSVLYYLTIIIGIIPPIPALGASGAIYGILGALSILAPSLVVYVYFFPVPIRIATVLWIILESVGSFNAASGIGSAAHLGGLLFGIAFGIYYKNRMMDNY